MKIVTYYDREYGYLDNGVKSIFECVVFGDTKRANHVYWVSYSKNAIALFDLYWSTTTTLKVKV